MNQPKREFAGLIELMQLQDYMNPKFHILQPEPTTDDPDSPDYGGKATIPRIDVRKVQPPTAPPSVNDFGKVFQRRWTEYQNKYPGASIDQYRRHAIDHITRQIEIIRRDAPSAWDVEIIKLAEIYINDFLLAESKETGINCQLNPDQLKRLFSVMQGPYIEGREIDFLSALTPDDLPPTFRRLKWTDKAAKTGRANKSTLRAFLTAIKGEEPVTLSDAQKFADDAGKAIRLNKPKPGNTQTHNVKKFEIMISEILNHKTKTP